MSDAEKKYDLFINSLNKEIQDEDHRRNSIEQKVINYTRIISIFITIITIFISFGINSTNFFQNIYLAIFALVFYVITIICYISSIHSALKTLIIVDYNYFDTEAFINDYNKLEIIDIKKAMITELSELIKKKEEDNDQKVTNADHSYKLLKAGMVMMIITVIISSAALIISSV